MKVIELAFCCYAVADMERAREFYEGVLKLTPATVTNSEHGQWTEYEFGDDALALGCAPGFKPSKPYVEPPKRDWREIYSDPRYLALVESQQQEARLQNIAIISSAATQAGAAWYQSQQPVYNYYGPSPAATYFYGYEQNAQLRALNNNLASQNAQLHQLSDDVWRLRRDLR